MSEPTDMEYIPAAIKAMRERLELTQSDLAKQVGIVPQQVSSWETGHRQIGLMNLLRIIEGVGSDLEEFGRILKQVGGRTAETQIPHRVTLDLDEVERMIERSVRKFRGEWDRGPRDTSERDDPDADGDGEDPDTT